MNEKNIPRNVQGKTQKKDLPWPPFVKEPSSLRGGEEAEVDLKLKERAKGRIPSLVTFPP